MKKDDQHKKLKQLSDQHEVPFNPAAWDRMEALLDSTPPPEEPRPGSSFFNYKNIFQPKSALIRYFNAIIYTNLYSPSMVKSGIIKAVHPLWLDKFFF